MKIFMKSSANMKLQMRSLTAFNLKIGLFFAIKIIG